MSLDGSLCYTSACRLSGGRIAASFQEVKYGRRQAVGPTNDGAEVSHLLGTRDTDAPAGEVLRRCGLTLGDLRVIEEAVESADIAGLEIHPGHRKHFTPGTPEAQERVCRELREMERALADRSVKETLLKKTERWGSPSGAAEPRSPRL